MKDSNYKDTEHLLAFIDNLPTKYSNLKDRFTVGVCAHFIGKDGELISGASFEMVILYRGIGIANTYKNVDINKTIKNYMKRYIQQDIEIIDLFYNPLYIAVNGNINKTI